MKFQKKELMPMFCFITYSQPVFIHHFSEKTYKNPMKLGKDEFNVPVAARSNVEQAAVVKFWRANGKFTCQGNILLYDGKNVRYYI